MDISPKKAFEMVPQFSAISRLPAAAIAFSLLIVMSLLFRQLACAQDSNNGLIEKSLQIQGLPRTYYVHLPRNYNGQSLPLLFCLHGGDGTAIGTANWTQLNQTADRNAFIVVYPQGFDRHWQDGRTHFGYRYVDDVAFVKAMISQMVSDYGIDRHKVYAIGISNGGFMVERLACEIPAQLAAVCSIAASRLKNMNYSPSAPIPLMFILGTEDPFVPFGGGAIKSDPNAPGEVYSAVQTVQFWAHNNDCSPFAPVIFDRSYPDATRVTIKVLQSPSNADLEFCTVYGGGHCWPGEQMPLPESMIGKTSPFDANSYAWAFFSRHAN